MSKDIKVEFFSSIPFLNDIEECRPKPLSKALPDWWKNGAVQINGEPTVKECPSFIQMFKNSYVIPMWCDTEFKITDHGVQWRFSHPSFRWESHSENQFLDIAPQNVRDNTKKIMKAISPWHIKTPKGYSVYQMSAFYEFNENFEIMPGIIDTDIHHEANQQVMLTGKNETFTIKRGEPFAVYFPFKRDSFVYETRNATKEDLDTIERNKLKIFSKFKRGYKLMHQE